MRRFIVCHLSSFLNGADRAPGIVSILRESIKPEVRTPNKSAMMAAHDLIERVMRNDRDGSSAHGSAAGGAALEDLIGNDAQQDHCAHHREVQRAGDAEQVHQILQDL